MSNPIFACTRCADDWRQFLARPTRHWRVGRSAHSLAAAWQNANGFPPQVLSALAHCNEFANATPLIGIPEYRTPLRGVGKFLGRELFAAWVNDPPVALSA